MKKLVLFTLLLVVIGIIVFLARTPQEEKPAVTSEKQITSTVFQTIVEEEKTDFAELKLSYPKLPNGQYKEVANYVAAAKSDHQKSVKDAEEFAREFGGGAVYQTILNYTIATSSNTTSFIFKLYSYTGGAHGNTGVATFTYKNTDKKLVSLKDVFTDPQYLETISTEARKYLASSLGEYSNKEDIAMGTAPTADNFAAWYLTDTAITFIFGQYQVGPYVIGMPRFAMPKTTVANILNPAFK